ncbi:MAG: general secretion pathway protein G [Halioglobus sp.]|jgi:general secretion pathway protein G
MKYLFIAFTVLFLQACVNQVQLAKQELDRNVLRGSPIVYKNVHTYPGNIVCGRYSTSRKNRDDLYTAFIYRDKKVDTRPLSLDLAIFCTQDSQRSLMVITGIDLQQCRSSQLPKILEDFKALGKALMQYEADNGTLPRDRQGLDALVNPSTIQPKPRRFKSGGYIAQLHTDPWGNPYLYNGPVFAGSKGQYSIRTLGADNTVGGALENADVDTEYLAYIDHIGGCGSGK